MDEAEPGDGRPRARARGRGASGGGATLAAPPPGDGPDAAEPDAPILRPPVRAGAGAGVTAGAGMALGRYRLERRLGSGGFGTVWLAWDERLERAVAVKAVSSGGGASERARREARAAARLDHPAIVSLFDAGEEPGVRWLVSEYVDGRTLGELEADGALSDRDVLRVGIALCEALAHAHARGVVHRDVKPDNVIVPVRGDVPAKVCDFGVAMIAGDVGLTRAGDVVGTLAYMAPEQAGGELVDDRADLYATGLVLWEALAGSHPVRGATPAQTARRLGRAIPSLARARPDLPPELCAAVDRAVAVAPEDRGELDDLRAALIDALDAVDDEGSLVAPHPLERRRRLRVPSPRGTAALVAGGLVGAVLATAPAPPPAAPAVLAAAAALAVALAPRLGWLACVATLAGWLAGVEQETPALLLGAAAAPVPLLLRDAGHLWSLPGLAPALGLLQVALAYPALAACAGSLRRRAALGALGASALLAVETVTGRALLLGTLPQDARAPDVAALPDALAALAVSGRLALVPAWALAAALLPALVRGRWVALDLVSAVAWAGGLVAGTVALAGAPVPGAGVAPALAAALGAAGVAVAFRRLGREREPV